MPGDDVARLDEGAVLGVALLHQLVTELHELVDVELVVGEEHEVLEVLRVGAGVVAQTAQRVVDARCGEKRQRMRLARMRRVRAVGDAVVHRVQIRQVEHVAQQEAPLGAHRAFDVVVLGEREVHRDRLRAGADLERDVVILQQQAELLQVVGAEQIRPRQGRLVAPRPGDETIGQTRVGTRDGVGAHAHERIAGAHVLLEAFAGDEALQRLAQPDDALLVDGLHLRQCGGRIVVAGRCDERQAVHGCIVPKRHRRANRPGRGAALRTLPRNNDSLGAGA
jgi:hypothetical protein